MSSSTRALGSDQLCSLIKPNRRKIRTATNVWRKVHNNSKLLITDNYDNKQELLLRCFVAGLFVSSTVESFHLMEERQGSKIELQQNYSFDTETEEGTQNIASHVCVCECFFFFLIFISERYHLMYCSL